MKATAIAPANIAFIKYWGKKDEKLRLPENGSISMSLDKCLTTTTVAFDKKYKKDTFQLDGKQIESDESERVFEHLDRIRKQASISLPAKIVSKNNFPKSSGIASSASGFAALTLAASRAADLDLSEKWLSIFARIGSGSACRSIPDGFVEWKEGNSHKTSYAYSLYASGYWDLCDVLAIVDQSKKTIGSTHGQKLGVTTSIFHRPRVKAISGLIHLMKQAFQKKDFQLLGEIIEKDCVYMHAVMMSSNPALFYWTAGTMEVIHAVLAMRDSGIPAYFTIDAGPNVHVICQKKDAKKVNEQLEKLALVQKTIINRPTRGAHLTRNHLF